jgi:hypothetical protein
MTGRPEFDLGFAEIGQCHVSAGGGIHWADRRLYPDDTASLLLAKYHYERFSCDHT